jgi:hypothetical protein
MHGDAVPLFFYADLFLRHPETRDLFPVSMAAQRDEETVHSFCDQVQHELVTLLNEKAARWEEVERLRRRIIASGEPPGARPEDAHLRAYLETLLNNVEDWEQSEKESLAAARGELPFPFPPGAQGQSPAPGPTSYSSPPPFSTPPPGSSPYSSPPPAPPSSPSPPSYSSPPAYSSPPPGSSPTRPRTRPRRRPRTPLPPRPGCRSRPHGDPDRPPGAMARNAACLVTWRSVSTSSK